MPNVFHKDFTLDDNHALNANTYANIAARDADSAFNTSAANIDKIVRIDSPVSYYILTDTNPTWQELTNVTAGNVTTSDTLLATQLLLGNGGQDIITEPDLTYDGSLFSIAGAGGLDLAVSSSLSFNGIDILADSAGFTALNNIDVIDTITETTIESAMDTLPNLTLIGSVSGAVAGPSGEWNTDGFDIGLNDAYAINGVDVLSDAAGTITLSNINILDVTTETTIESAIDALPNIATLQSLAVAYADAGTDALWGWDDVGNTYRNLSAAEAIAAIGAGNVSTSDVLFSNQILLGNNGTDIIADSRVTFNYSVSTAVLNGNEIPVSAEDTSPAAITFNNDGSKIYFAGTQNDSIYEYSLSTNFDLSSETFTQSFSVATEDDDPRGLSFNDTGSKMYMVGRTTDSVYQYALSTNFDISTAVVIGSGLSLATEDTAPTGITFNTDGSKMYFVGQSSNNVHEYNCSINFDSSTAIIFQSFDITPQDGTPRDIYFTADGLKMLLCGTMTNRILSYKLSIAFDISTAIFAASLDVSAIDTGASGVALNNDMTKLYMTALMATDIVEFDLSPVFEIIIPTKIGANFGVSTSTPDTIIDIGGDSSNDSLRLRSGDGANQIKFSSNGGNELTHAIKTLHDAADQFGNAIEIYLWDADTDAVGDVGTLKVMRIQGDGRIGINKNPSAVVDITSEFGDGTPVITIESGGNVGTTDFRTGDRDPNGVVNGMGPDVYFADRGALSGTYESRSVATDQIWLKRRVLPTNIVEFQNSTELDDLASGGIITIAVNTTWHVMNDLTTANRIVVNNGVSFRVTGEFNATASITYSGTATFITAPGGFVQFFGAVSINSSSTGTFFEGTTAANGLVVQQCFLGSWTSLGSVTDGQVFLANTGVFNISGGLTLINTIQVDATTFNQFGSNLDGPFFTLITNNPNSLYSFTDVAGRNLGTGSVFDIDTRMHPDAAMLIQRCFAPTGDIFKQTALTNATINSVADGSIATGTITAMADNGSGGTTISSTTTYFEDELVTITGTTSYNGFFQIFNVVAGVSFDTITTFVADDATGSIDSVRLTMTLAGGHGISTGNSIKIIETNFYNGFVTTLNVATNDITVNGTFISTNTGSIERELSLDQTDRRIAGSDNEAIANSRKIATAHVNDNSTATGTIVNNTFTDMVFGTVGVALIANSTMERWRLINEINGTFEYIGQNPFDGDITFDFTVESSGGTVDFRFKWTIDRGAGFIDLDDDVESLVAVGSDAQSVTKTFPLFAIDGDLIKPQITRNSGSSGITSTYVTMFVSE